MSLYAENSYLLNEALKNIETSLREQIAQEIEAEWQLFQSELISTGRDEKIYKSCAAIARGKK
jgi:hypothetical protein